jgi:hypothetical protein
MGIVRTAEWKLSCPLDEADERFRQAFASLELEPSGPPGQIHGSAKRSFRRNRWAAEIDVQLTAQGNECQGTCRVDMAGNKHYEVMADVVSAVGENLFDDGGLAAAVERLGKVGRLFGRKEVAHLRNVVHADERVLELGQGQYGSKQGLVVLTTTRLFFLEKSLGSETLEEFPLSAISSLGMQKKMTGETLQIFASGHTSEIKQMDHGQADAIARAFRSAKSAPAPAASTTPAAQDPVAQLERLAGLRDKGVLSEEEFQSAKKDLLGRL